MQMSPKNQFCNLSAIGVPIQEAFKSAILACPGKKFVRKIASLIMNF